MGWPRLRAAPLTILCFSVLTSSLARGVDFIGTPKDTSVTMSAIAEWASPGVLGWLLVVFSLLAIGGLIFGSPPVQTISHIALAGIFLVMGLCSLWPAATTLGWGWRAPVSYILGSAVVHWYAAHSWFNRWVERRGRPTLDS